MLSRVHSLTEMINSNRSKAGHITQTTQTTVSGSLRGKSDVNFCSYRLLMPLLASGLLTKHVLIRGMSANGEMQAPHVFMPEPPDVKAVREKTGLLRPCLPL